MISFFQLITLLAGLGIVALVVPIDKLNSLIIGSDHAAQRFNLVRHRNAKLIAKLRHQVVVFR